MKHALTMWNDICPVHELSEPEGIDVAALIERDGEKSWQLVRADLVFPDEREAKKFVFMKRLKGK